MHSLLQAELLQIITTGRLWSIVAGVVGLAGLIIGRIALLRSARNIRSAQRMGSVALIMGLISVIVSGYHLASTTGGFGTGKGRAGAIIAMIIGLIGIIFGRLALTRSRRIARRNGNAITTFTEKT